MRTNDLAHRFFHEPDKRGEYANVNTSFEYYATRSGQLVWRYFSYSTCIGEIRRNKAGELCLIISLTRYSNSTGKHLSELLSACPYHADHIFYVPRVGDGFFYGDYRYLKGTYDFERVLKNIADMTEKELRKEENRMCVLKNIRMYDAYAEAFKDTTAAEKRLRKSKKVAKAIDIATEGQRLLNEKRIVWRQKRAARIAEQEAKRKADMAAARERLEQYFADGDKLAKLQLIFARNYWEEELTEEMRDFRNTLYSAGDSQGRRLSYVWLDEDGNARTSQNCSVPHDDVMRLLAYWKHHQNIIGQKAGVYTVVENTPDIVKVGCHVIPTWNIQLLCQALNVQ